ncbi:MAG: hypothetical protein ACI4DK_09450 [Lachnospiraceae bacterium]
MEEYLMTDEQFEVYNSLVNFTNELIDKQPKKEQQALKEQLKNILANNKPLKNSIF